MLSRSCQSCCRTVQRQLPWPGLDDGSVDLSMGSDWGCLDLVQAQLDAMDAQIFSHARPKQDDLPPPESELLRQFTAINSFLQVH